MDVTPTPETAVRDFRVFGYEDADAEGEPWELGAFRYEVDGPRTLQEFEVDDNDEDGPRPKLRSVTFAVDSNWGADYCCLYRFRVHSDRKVSLPTTLRHNSCSKDN